MCGIWGIINREPEDFDYCSFTTLGIANDSRGGDSCGIFIDGDVEYGVVNNKFFSSFMFKSKLLNEKYNEKTLISIGHDRKASVGAINETTAQPVVIRNNNGDIEFVMIHNGTIYNYEDLAKKYIPDIQIKGMTDSQVMGHIFYNKGYDVLKEYRGGGAFVIVDYRSGNPEVFLFKGESIEDNTTKKVSEERPLYIALNNAELVFSSIPIWLYSVRPWSSISSMKCNVLLNYDFNTGELVEKQVYDRKTAFQTRQTVCYYNYKDYYTGGGSANNSYSSTGQWIRQEAEENLYYTYPRQLLDGKYIISTYGRICDKHEKSAYMATHEISFFAGVAMESYSAYKFISKLAKLARMEHEMFFCCFENLVRYFSIDQLYFNKDKMVKATGIDEFEVYTGKFQMLGIASIRDYNNGSSIGFGTGGTASDAFNLIEKRKFNYKELTKQCLLLINSLED